MNSPARIIASALMLSFSFLPSLVQAQSWQAQSGEKQIAVLELFTAEGCGLCPPAERWLSRLPEQNITDENVIILGFHIDYLDDKKAWVDRFASPVFSDRQKQLAQINLYNTVYTPEFIVSGEIIHNWRKHFIDSVKYINHLPPEASIELDVEQNNEHLVIEVKSLVTGDENQGVSSLYLAMIEDDVLSKVTGGDNAGALFNHQHLVRNWLGPFTVDSHDTTITSHTVAINEEWNLEKMSVVALVQNLENGFVLQSLKLPLY